MEIQKEITKEIKEYTCTVRIPEFEIKEIITNGLEERVRAITTKMPVSVKFKNSKARFNIDPDGELVTTIDITYVEKTVCSD